MTTLTIDGKKIAVPDGSSILDAASALRIEIPTLCHIEGLEAYGGCRLCMVEVEGSKSGFLPACATKVAEGMVVHSATPGVIALRRSVIEMILAEHPADCFNCKKMGECRLHEYCLKLGVVKFETGLEKKNRHPDVSHPFYSHDANKCILCGKCVRVCESLQCSDVLTIAGRGRSARVAPAFDLPLGQSTCVGCGNCVANCPVGALLPRDRRFPGYQYVTKTRTVCPYCGVGCEIELLVSDGKVVGVNPADGPSNRGLLCVKGRFAYNFIDHPDRLTTPLVRKNGVLVESSWDEALDLIAATLIEVRDTRGPQAIAGLSSARCTNEENYLFQKLFRFSAGTNNIDHCARLCHASTVTGLARTLGSGAMTNSIDEIDIQDAIFITGSNTTETHPVIGSRIKRAVKRGARLVVADPRRTELAALAEVYLPLKPGTNVALYNAMARTIIAEHLEDTDFIGARTEGFAEYAAAVDEWTPERAAAVCGVEAADIRAAARLYAQASAAGIYYAMGVTQHSSGTDGVVSLSNLALLCGKIGRPGCGINPLRGQNNVQGACDMGCLPGDLPGYRKPADEKAASDFEAAWGRRPPQAQGLTSTEIMDEASKGKIGFLYIMGENPAISDPDSTHARRALGNAGFLVVQDIFPTETTAFADVVLPAACFAEKDGTFTNTERRVQRVRRAVSSPGEAREDLSILQELMGRIESRATDSVQSTSPPALSASLIFEEIAKLVPQYRGMNYSRIEKVGLQWPCPDQEHPGTPILHLKAMTRGAGLFAFAQWKPPAETESADYPLVFTTGRNLYQYHTRTMTGRIDGITRIAGGHYMEIHPDTAALYGLAEGDRVRIESRRGKLETVVRTRSSVKPGVVFMPFHYAAASANLLTNGRALDPFAKIPELKVCAVRVEKIAAGS